jgi:hypothetical protein
VFTGAPATTAVAPHEEITRAVRAVARGEAVFALAVADRIMGPPSTSQAVVGDQRVSGDGGPLAAIGSRTGYAGRSPAWRRAGVAAR